MGRAIAVKLAQEGVDLAIVARDAKNLRKLCADIEAAYHVKALPIPGDLSKIAGLSKIMAKVEREYHALHILINNAGGPPPGTLFDVQDKDWEKALNQNLKSVIFLTRLAVPLMKRRKFGRIINITSQLVKEPSPSMILSNTARTAVAAFAKTISHQLASDNITVHTLCPANIMTERLHSLVEIAAKKNKQTGRRILKKMIESIPMKRIGTPEEFADVAVFLASERASYLTGTTLAVDGGITKSLM